MGGGKRRKVEVPSNTGENAARELKGGGGDRGGADQELNEEEGKVGGEGESLPKTGQGGEGNTSG